MGGLIGMFLAAAPNAPIRSLVVNDVGPVLPRAALLRIAEYVGRDERFPDLAALEAHLRQIHALSGRSPMRNGGIWCGTGIATKPMAATGWPMIRGLP